MTRITENTIEEFSIELLERLGYQYIYAPDLPVRGTQTGIAHDLPASAGQAGGEKPERSSYATKCHSENKSKSSC